MTSEADATILQGAGARGAIGSPVPADLPGAVRRVLAAAALISTGRLEIRLPDGRGLAFSGAVTGPRAVVEIRDYRFAGRLARKGPIGLAESYVKGEWDSPDLAACLSVLAANEVLSGTSSPFTRWARVWQRIRHAANRNTRSGSRRNIRAHYDLGNRFYGAWLDPGMTYSAGLFSADDDDLERAQQCKFQRLAERIGLAPGQHVLEIGCGWGGFAEYAARECGCRVTALTISREQAAYATARICAAGLGDRVAVELRDYRDERGTYDRIVSIEMVEAVGEAYWPVYFQQIHDRLRPGGRAGLQAITIREERMARYRRNIDFIRHSVFPGGMLASPSVLHGLGARAGLRLVEDFSFGQSYVRTLQHWRSRFDAAWDSIRTEGFDDSFRRFWTFYLAYCEAGFRTEIIDVRQIVYQRP